MPGTASNSEHRVVGGGEVRLLATARVNVRPDGTLQFDVERVELPL